MRTKRDPKTGAIMYIKTPEDIEKENIRKTIRDLVLKNEKSDKRIKSLEKKVTDLEKKIKMLSENDATEKVVKNA